MQRADYLKLFKERFKKFRAWDEAKKCFVLSPFDILGEVIIFDLIKQYSLENLFSDIIITQATGIKDKDGKMIYEGDILELEERYVSKQNIVVNFQYGAWAFNCVCDGMKETGWVESIEDKKIIGNIFENPELIPKIC